MATVENRKFQDSRAAVSPTNITDETRLSDLHRIEEVRKRQGLSLRSASRQMSVDVRVLREQEQPESDLRLSELMRWQGVLGVPASELLSEPEATQCNSPRSCPNSKALAHGTPLASDEVWMSSVELRIDYSPKTCSTASKNTLAFALEKF